MTTARNGAAALLAAGALLALVALNTPWWTFKIEDEGRDGETQESLASARPFDTGLAFFGGGALIGSLEASLSGALVLGALLGLAAGAGLLIGPGSSKRGPAAAGATIGIVAGVALVVALILPIFTWPDSGGLGPQWENEFDAEPSFWDSEDSTGEKVSLFANVGWYLGIAAFIPAVVGGILGFVGPSGPAPASYGAGYYAPPPTPVYPPAPPPPSTYATFQPVPPTLGAAGKTASGARRMVKCPQCGTRVNAPATRPVNLVCPTCRFTARME